MHGICTLYTPDTSTQFIVLHLLLLNFDPFVAFFSFLDSCLGGYLQGFNFFYLSSESWQHDDKKYN